MRIKIFIAAFLLTLSLAPLVHSAEKVSGYRAVFVPYYSEGSRVMIVIRSFSAGPVKKFLIVDPDDFSTFIADASKVDASRKASEEDLSKTPFAKALQSYTAPDGKLQNSGLVKGEGRVKGMFLTVDLCPSKKDLDKFLFTSAEGLTPGRPVPVAIAVSGLWIERHGEEFNWLVKEEQAGRLAITWVNHSYSHPYSPGRPFGQNFLLTPGTDLDSETLRQEIVLIEHGETPSPFFRFPGLVSDSKLLEKLKTLSLIPVGANAWIAKREAPKEGSIILVHGNGNEPEGIKWLLEYFERNRDGFKNGEKRLLPLRDALAK